LTTWLACLSCTPRRVRRRYASYEEYLAEREGTEPALAGSAGGGAVPDVSERMQDQLAEERDEVSHQTGDGAGSPAAGSALTPRKAEDRARAADKEVRHEMAEDIKDGLGKLTGKR
jgi:hypothetical protein